MRQLSIFGILACLLACLARPGAAETLPNGGWDAAWSPDGALVAFTSGTPHGVPNLWVARTDGPPALRQLTRRGAHRPAWQPGTSNVLFGSLRGAATYYRIDAAAAIDRERPVTDMPAQAEDVRFSPNGALFAYALPSKDGKARNLCYGRTNGGGGAELTRNFWVREWAWMPDGTALALVVGRATGTSLWIANLQTKDVDLFYQGYCSAPAYAPDGSKLALAVPDLKSGFTLEIIDLARRKGTRLTVASFDGQRILWSPDSATLYFAANPRKDQAIWRINADGTGLTRLTPTGIRAFAPALSPDGRRLAYQAMTPDAYSPELYLADADGAHARRIVTSAASSWQPHWSPDGRKLAFLSDAGNATTLVVKTLTGRGGRTAIPLAGDEYLDAQWLPGGKRLLLGSAGRLLIADLSARPPSATPITALTTPAQSPRVAKDEIVYTEWNGMNARLAAVKLDGTGKRPLTQIPPAPANAPPATTGGMPYMGGTLRFASATTDTEAGNPHAGLGISAPNPDLGTPATPQVVDVAPAASPGGTLIAFARQGQIWLVARDGTNERPLTQLAAPDAGARRLVSNPAWAPDGRTLCFLSVEVTANETTVEVWTAGLTPKSEHRLYRETAGSEYGRFYVSCTNPPVFTPDGAGILFTSVAEAEPRIVILDLAGGAPRTLATGLFPALDPSGRRLAYVEISTMRERVRVRELATGKEIGVR